MHQCVIIMWCLLQYETKDHVLQSPKIQLAAGIAMQQIYTETNKLTMCRVDDLVASSRSHLQFWIAASYWISRTLSTDTNPLTLRACRYASSRWLQPRLCSALSQTPVTLSSVHSTLSYDHYLPAFHIFNHYHKTITTSPWTSKQPNTHTCQTQACAKIGREMWCFSQAHKQSNDTSQIMIRTQTLARSTCSVDVGLTDISRSYDPTALFHSFSCSYNLILWHCQTHNTQQFTQNRQYNPATAANGKW